MINKIKDIILNYVEIEESFITAESNLRTDIGLSSLDLISVATELENTFGTKISERKILSLKTIGDLIECVE